MQIQPVTLEGAHVRLEPLHETHHAALCDIAFDPVLWRWTSVGLVTPDDVRAYIQNALKAQAQGREQPFVTIEHDTGRVIGSTRFLNMDQANRRVEIGYTWIAQPWQRTLINTEAKYLMLRYAFETFSLIRVELKTDALNAKSRAAIQRIGAKQEGILRKHIIVQQSGRIRDTVYFSILDSEWPHVKAELERKLAISRP